MAVRSGTNKPNRIPLIPRQPDVSILLGQRRDTGESRMVNSVLRHVGRRCETGVG